MNQAIDVKPSAASSRCHGIPVADLALSKRRFSVIALTWLGSALWPTSAWSLPSVSHTHSLPVARSLPDALAAALRRGSPLVVMVSLEGCAYCRIVREQYLSPLLQQGLTAVQVDWRSTQPLQDFAGPGTHDAAVRRWRIRMAPTLLFLGPGGREVAPRLVGVSSMDFYGAYLDARLAEARKALQS